MAAPCATLSAPVFEEILLLRVAVVGVVVAACPDASRPNIVCAAEACVACKFKLAFAATLRGGDDVFPPNSLAVHRDVVVLVDDDGLAHRGPWKDFDGCARAARPDD